MNSRKEEELKLEIEDMLEIKSNFIILYPNYKLIWIQINIDIFQRD